MNSSESSFSFDQAKAKLQSWCAYRERSTHETLQKINSYQLITEEVNELLLSLQEDNFINETRFVESFVTGKFRIKKWGRNKIKAHIGIHRVETVLLNKFLHEMDDISYVDAVDYWLNKKFLALKSEKDPWKKKQKTIQYVASKGFEIDLILDRWGKLNLA
ncbi:MAG: regulatory protein [Psychromonas sp.]|jgi:regulatory protein